MVAADVLARRGIADLLQSVGHRVSTSSEGGIPPGVSCGVVVVVHADLSGAPDRWRAIRTVPGLSPHRSTRVVAVAPVPVDLWVVLRLAEAGVTHLVDAELLAGDEPAVARALVGLDERGRLPQSAAVRATLGLGAGRVEPFLRSVEHISSDVWLRGVPQATCGLSRREIARIRAVARDVAGLPPPDARRFSTSVRRAPAAPEWTEVRRFVLRLWGRYTPSGGRAR